MFDSIFSNCGWIQFDLWTGFWANNNDNDKNDDNWINKQYLFIFGKRMSLVIYYFRWIYFFLLLILYLSFTSSLATEQEYGTTSVNQIY